MSGLPSRACRLTPMRERLNWLADHLVGIIIVTACVVVAAVLIVMAVQSA